VYSVQQQVCAKFYPDRLRFSSTRAKNLFLSKNKKWASIGLETCINDERQFKTAKRPQAASDATVRKQFFRDNFVTFHRRSKRIAFLELVNFSTSAYMQLFNFRDCHMTTFWHLSESRLSIGKSK